MFSIGIYNGNCVLVLHNKVKASMKSFFYDVSTCFNKCSCNCKVGTRKGTVHAPGTERKTCTHGITHLVSLSFSLFDGLAEHLLVELRTRLATDAILDMHLQQQRNDIRLLMAACGKQNENLLLSNGGGSIYNCLAEFSVGTDLSKSCSRYTARANAKENGLMRNFRYENPKTAARNIIDRGKNKGKNKSIGGDGGCGDNCDDNKTNNTNRSDDDNNILDDNQ